MHQNCHERFVCWPQVAIGREPLWRLKGLLVHSDGIQRMKKGDCCSRAALSGRISEGLL